MALWIELLLKFEQAAVAGDKRLERQILGYAAWCRSERSGKLPNDTSTAVTCAFYENLPTRRELWGRFPDWFFYDEFMSLVPTFGYLLSADDLQQLQEAYARARPARPPRPKPARKR